MEIPHRGYFFRAFGPSGRIGRRNSCALCLGFRWLVGWLAGWPAFFFFGIFFFFRVLTYDVSSQAYGLLAGYATLAALRRAVSSVATPPRSLIAKLVRRECCTLKLKLKLIVSVPTAPPFVRYAHSD